MNNANFMVPGMYEHYGLNFKFLELMKMKPEMFYENAKIGAVYGNFQFCVFDGGRIFGKYGYSHSTKEEIETIVNTYNNTFNVPVRVVFTNPMLKKEDFHNRFGKVILEILNRSGMNEVVINSAEFEQYLRENYPNLTFISSTTKCLNTSDKFMEEFNEHQYKMICLDYNLNRNFKMLNQIPEEQRDQCEFLVNAICPPGCPNRKEHYRLNGLYSLSYGKPYATQDCPIFHNTLHPVQRDSNNNLSPTDIYETYVPQGFVNFKLEGRTLGVVENLLNYVYYMVKPEYHHYVIDYILAENGNEKLLNREKCQYIN
jgi:hypothetical protein